LWHRRLAVLHTDHLNRLNVKDLVFGLPKMKFENNRICDACLNGKQTRSSFKLKDVISSKKPPEILHINLFVLEYMALNKRG